MIPLLLACSEPSPPVQPYPEHRVGRNLTSNGSPSTVTPQNPNGKRVYYDAVHGARHLHDRDNRRYRTDYHTVSGWFRFLQGVRTAGYQVHTEGLACFDRSTLDDFDVFIVGEQTYHARFMTPGEQADLIDWVKDGGGLLATAEHTNAHYMGDTFNALARPLPVKARFDSICDSATSHRSAPDWVKLSPNGEHPVTRGVEDFWFYNGCSLDTEHGVLMSSASSWSDAYAKNNKPVHNGNKRKDPGELTGSLAGVAAFEFGEGRVVVIGDHNGLSNTELYQADHHRLAMNAVQWLAGEENNPAWSDWSYPDGYDFAVFAPKSGGFHLHQKNDDGTFRTLLTQWGKEPQLRAWAHPRMQAGHDALVLGAPIQPLSDAEMQIVDGYLEAGKPVIWTATLGSLTSKATTQLQAHFGLEVTLLEEPLKMRRPLEVLGDPAWTTGIPRIFAPKGMGKVRVTGAAPIVQLRHGSWHIEQVHADPPVLIDLISYKKLGNGEVYLVAPLDLFDDTALPAAERQDVIRQATAELAIRMLKIPVGDDTRFID